jgi:nitrogen regulatory protein PII
MKMITAMIQPFMLNKITSALEAIEGFPGMTVTDVRGFGRRMSAHEQHSLHIDELKSKVRIEIATSDEMAEQIIKTLQRSAHTGNDGDGKIFVWSLEQTIRVQTDERDDVALR